VEWYAIEKKKTGDTPVLYYDTFTNNVVYTRLMFDVRVLPDDLVPYAALLSEVLGSLNTKNYTYGDLDKALNLHTGGFNTSLQTFLEDRNDDKLIPKFSVSSKAMNSKVDKMFELLSEIITNTNYSDKDRLKAVLTRHQSRLDANVKQNGFGYTRTRLLSYITNEGMFDEITGGIEYYWFVTKLTKNFDEQADEIINNLNKTSKLLFNRDNMLVSLTSAKDDYKSFASNLKTFTKTLGSDKPQYQTWSFKPEKKNEGLLAASKVQYVIKGYDYKKLGYKWDGKMRVLDQVLSRDWLQNQVRVIGGAYGGFSSFASTGYAYFASYRDPNLRETLKNYDDTPGYLKDFNADRKEMTRFIIGTIARLDRPLTPSERGNMAVNYSLQNITKEELQRERQAVLSTSAQDIKAMQQMVADVLAQDTYCVYGNEEKIETNKDLFKELVKLNP
jgi:Zn-dependent M16 (insulinase) family peptidase